MATAVNKICCIICNKEKSTIRCGGCLEEFCYNHWENHRQELNRKLDEIEVNRDTFRQTLTEHIKDSNNQLLIQQINQWEQNSIKKIQQTAEESRQILLKHTNEYIKQIEINLNKLTYKLKESRQENDFNEINLRQFQKELTHLTEELTKPLNIVIQEDSTSFISKISINTSQTTIKSNIHSNTRWIQNALTVAGGNGKGNGLNQFSGPSNVYVEDDHTIYISDYENHRVMKWKCCTNNGQVIAGGNEKGNEMNQLNYPSDIIIDKEKKNLIICDYDNKRIVKWPYEHGTNGQTIISDITCCKLTIDNNGYLYLSDWKKNEVRQWKMNETHGTLVAGGNGNGNRLDQLNWPTFTCVDDEQSVYVSDTNNHRVMKWMKDAKEGIIVAGNQVKGNGLAQLCYPCGVMVDHMGTVYVADRDNHRIMRWYKGAKQGSIVVGGNGKGEQANQLNGPIDLSFDQQGNLYVADYYNHRVQKYNIDQTSNK